MQPENHNLPFPFELALHFPVWLNNIVGKNFCTFMVANKVFSFSSEEHMDD